MEEKDLETIVSEEDNLRDHDYIESWFQVIINKQHHSILQLFLAPNPLEQLVSHIQASIEVHFLNMDI